MEPSSFPDSTAPLISGVARSTCVPAPFAPTCLCDGAQEAEVLDL